MRIEAERVQLTDLTDPTLVGGRFEITPRRWFAGSNGGSGSAWSGATPTPSSWDGTA
jgi:hypothetical protein